MALAVREWFGSETLNIRPHIMTIAKGSVRAISRLVGRLSVMVAKVIAGDEFNHSYTYSSHPVAAAVANENLRIMEEENIVGHVRDTAPPI